MNALTAIIPTPPASLESVFGALMERSPQTGRELREATGLPRRTVYAALLRLRELGLLQERASLRDTRQTYYWVSGHVATTRNGLPVASAMA
jgi:predicted transcriptional regulator